MEKPLAVLDSYGRPMAALSDLTKEQRLTLQGGDLGYCVAANATGKVVTLSSALTISAVWACIARSAQAMASLPIDVFKKTAGGRQKMSGWLDDLIALSPNADQTPVEFWEGMLSWLLASGNAYAEIDRVNGRPSALLPIPSMLVKPIRNKVTNELMYEVRDPGTSRNRVLRQQEMLHLRGWGFGGDECQSASKRPPRSAPKSDPFGARLSRPVAA